MLYRRKSIRDEYQEMAEAELAKKQAEEKLAKAAEAVLKAKPKGRPKKVEALKTKKK